MPRRGVRTSAQVELGKRAKKQRKQLKLSQMELADRIDLHFTFVSSVERGERNLSLSSLLRLADGLQMNPAELVDGLKWEALPAGGSRD
jgi:transcriptional regulator with XRE-family HTH domain